MPSWEWGWGASFVSEGYQGKHGRFAQSSKRGLPSRTPKEAGRLGKYDDSELYAQYVFGVCKTKPKNVACLKPNGKEDGY